MRKEMIKDIQPSKLSERDIPKLKLKLLTPAETESLTGEKLYAYQIPYFDIKGKPTKFWRLKYLEQPATFGNINVPKYTQPKGMPPNLYLPPLVKWSTVATDTKQAIVITEGEKKAASVTKHYGPCIGLGGVYSFQSKAEGQSLIPDFDIIDMQGRRVYIIYDADLKSNKQVRAAMTRLAHQLTNRGAEVFTGNVPEMSECEKAGVDDYIYHRGAAAFEKDIIAECDEFSTSKALHAMNNEVCYVRDPSLIVRLNSMQRMGVQTFYDQYANRNITVLDSRNNLVKTNLAREWLKWPLRMEVENITYEPGKERFINDSINQWKGWGCEPKRGSVRPWNKLMSYVFGKDKAARHWFESWCAIQFQQPGVKLYSAALVWSVAEGTGKSLIGHTLGRIFGDNFSEIGHDDLIEGNNAWGVNKQFILGDEVTSNDQRAVADRLKRMITRNKIIIKIKYVPEYDLPDTLNYFFTSNHPNGLFMDDQDRRYFVWEIPGAPMEESFYLNEYDPWLNGSGPSHLFHYFLNYDIGNFTAKTRAPMTTAKADMISMSKSDIASWVHQLACAPENILKAAGQTIEKDLFTTTQLLRLYDPDKRTRCTLNTLGREMLRKGFCKLASPVKLSNGEQHIYWIVRNVDKWANAQTNEILEHADPNFSPVRKRARKKPVKRGKKA